VIPEIELPGHASAAIAAYPQLSCFPDEATKHPKNTTWSGDSTGKQVQQVWGVFPDVFAPTEYTFNFLQDVLDEVMPLFPANLFISVVMSARKTIGNVPILPATHQRKRPER
jgi:hexosaminidase